MSLTRVPAWSSQKLGQSYARCFSSGARHQNQGLLDIMQQTKQNSPYNMRSKASDRSTSSQLGRSYLPSESSTMKQLERAEKQSKYQRQMYRKWNAGDVYAPHDLSAVEQNKWKKGKKTPQSDAFDLLGINPVNEYKNFTMMSEYMSDMGRIKHSNETGLRPKNQRKIAKAIRRAIGLGLMPSVHRHPLVLKKSSPTRFR